MRIATLLATVTLASSVLGAPTPATSPNRRGKIDDYLECSASWDLARISACADECTKWAGEAPAATDAWSWLGWVSFWKRGSPSPRAALRLSVCRRLRAQALQLEQLDDMAYID
ncbi:hypothetical protein Q8F55_008608 [Vanrija albida]|uniref:Uncharacterized protein n=1 Tax=Vanrija albida TaxID=181172 RepID=A0ABR3PRA4_9TREE